MSRRFVSFVVLFALSIATRARAQDPILHTIDDLMREHRCAAALELLPHATGTPAELAGRAGLCEAELGRRSEAARHVAEALRAPADPWVVAHRPELLASLDSGSTSLSVPTPAEASAPVTPPPPQPADATAPLPQRASIPETFENAFRTEPFEDTPPTRTLWTFPAGRIGVAALASVSADFLLEGGRSPNVPAPDPLDLDGTSVMPTITCENGAYPWECPRRSAHISAGVELTARVAQRVSLVADVEFSAIVGAVDTRMSASVWYPASSVYRTYAGTDTSKMGFAFRVTPLLRVAGRNGRVLVGLGMRVGLSRRWFDYDLVEIPGPGGSGGTAHADYVRRSMNLSGVLEVAVALNDRRDALLMFRPSFGVKAVSLELATAVPLFRGTP